MNLVDGIHHATWLTQDIDRLKGFYERVLDASRTLDMTEEGVRHVYLEVGRAAPVPAPRWADWMTVAAAIVGIIGIGFGLWWADAVAATFISLDIVHDGWSNVRAAVHDLMDARPRRHDAREHHPVVARMQRVIEDCD